MTQIRLFLLIILLGLSNNINAQFRIIELNSGFETLDDSLFFNTTQTRHIKKLNDGWNVYFAESPDDISLISFPAIFTSENEIIFEKQFELTSDELANQYIQLHFLGINYTADIFVNNTGLYKHPGGDIPFTLDIPSEILNYDTPNTIRIKLKYNIDSENTIPLLQRFLFPKSYGGILRDVYLHFRPKAGIKKIEYLLKPDKKPYKNRFEFDVKLEDLTKIVADSLLENYDNRFKIEVHISKTTDTSKVYFNIWNINPLKSSEYVKNFYVRLRKVIRWQPKNPTQYIVSIKLTNGDGYVYDEARKLITIKDIEKKENKLFVDDKPFQINGVTYIRSLDKKTTYQQIENDIKTIKESGFNTIRFKSSFPHPYTVYLCSKFGLFTLIELPLNSVPERFSADHNFEQRAKSFIERAVKYYNRFPNVLAYGSGGSYLSNSSSHIDFINSISSKIKEVDKNLLTYTSFIGLDLNNANVDLSGIEIYKDSPNELIAKMNEVSDSSIYFISEAVYPTYNGATNGYLNDNSFEGQAKFFDDIITGVEDSKLSGFVLHSMFDYEGDYAPMFSGYNENNIYHIGIVSDNSNDARISYNLIKRKLKEGKSTTIPIGSNQEDAPPFFILAALVISVIIALLINSKRKFREDATRALLRPYNFYADIRDQRILSGFHSNTLILLLAGSNSLLVTILLFYLKNNILFDQILNSFGNFEFKKLISYLAWHPLEAFIYIYIGTIVLFILISIFVHASSFFVKTKVLFSSVYSVLIWASLPLALIVPLEAILFKVLLLGSYNNIIYITLILFFVWNIQRFLKGIYVIFDVRPLFVYANAFVVLIIISAGIIAYFQLTVSAFDYIYLAVKQYLIL